ncbi:MAG: glycosyltransferase family 2 protein [Lachnospiraceae bacterium]|nr:glycosyltransferase family 2 protein [Lachnospiraceae bacterium]
MFTYSLCMIVKNEERILARCLDSFAPLFDEIVVVDTGSNDRTKEIAATYTDRVFDFAWVDDFSAARNFAFSKCTGDYIYSCDADEVLDEVNRERFSQLMQAMLPEIEIVQMKYVDPRSTVLNTREEWRAKLFKRLRSFRWEDPVHETVRTEPVVFDSDVEILHEPEGEAHDKRDFSIFQKAYQNGTPFSKKLYAMYATELFKCGEPADFESAIPVFEARLAMEGLEVDAILVALGVLARGYRLTHDTTSFLKVTLRGFSGGFLGSSELCCELGQYFLEAGDIGEAARWFERALRETEPVSDARSGGDLAFLGLASCEEARGHEAEAKEYRKRAAEWHKNVFDPYA